MITEASLSGTNNSAIVEEPTPDVADAVVEDSAKHDDQYAEWLSKASEICGQEMRGDIDPVHKQAENIAPVNDLATQLGLENLTEIQSVIDEEEEAELNRMDEESREYDFTAEDVGICQSSGGYSPALEMMWNNIENCKLNIERLELCNEDANEMIMALESATVIDQETAIKLRDRIPGSMDNVNIKMFTRLPSSVGYKLAHEGSLAGKIIIGGLIIAGSIYLIYKILSWTIDGIKAIIRLIKRIRDKRNNSKKTHEKMGNETFDPETVDLEKMAKALFDDPTVEVKAKMKAAGLQPLNLREVKWCGTKDFNSLITPLLHSFIDDIDGSKVRIFNEILEQLVEHTHEGVQFTADLLNGIAAIPGEELNANVIANCLQEQLSFVNQYITDLNIPITFSNKSNIERMKAIYEWMDQRNKPMFDCTLNKAPSMKLISALGGIRFSVLDDEFAGQIASIRETLDPKAKKTIVAADTPDQANVRKEIIKDITMTFMVLSNMIRSIYHHTVYVEALITAEDKFLTQLKKYTA